jgi:uncharacterized protein (TIGR02145 family)
MFVNTIIKTGLAAILLLAFSCKKENNSIQSISDPGVQVAIKIGIQKWMSRNLNVNHYRNGDVIPQVKDANQWAALTTGAWCYYNNDRANGAIYGKIYNWYAVNDPRGLAPIGWHIPSDSEWTVLSLGLGGGDIAGGKLKDTGTVEAGTGLWLAPNTGATNSSGFTGLPGGHRSPSGEFFHIGMFGHWWSSTQVDATSARNQTVIYTDDHIARPSHDLHFGFSVRCLKD